MAFATGKAGIFSLDIAAGTPTDISAYCTSVSGSFTTDSHDTTAFGATTHTFIPGLLNATLSVEGEVSVTATEIFTYLNAARSGLSAGGSLSFVWGPMGSTATYPKYTGECYITDLSISDPHDDKVTFSLSLQCTGAVTATAY